MIGSSKTPQALFTKSTKTEKHARENITSFLSNEVFKYPGKSSEE
jgi:hypothetical protein